MKVPDFILKFVGNRIEKKIDLQEDSQMETKPWYQSKTIISGIVAGIIGIYNVIAPAKNFPPIPDWVFTVLAAIGVYSRATATATIAKS